MGGYAPLHKLVTGHMAWRGPKVKGQWLLGQAGTSHGRRSRSSGTCKCTTNARTPACHLGGKLNAENCSTQ